MKYYIICKNTGLAGTGIVIRNMQASLNAVLLQADIKFLYKKLLASDKYIAIQPTGVILGLLRSLISKKNNIYFIFDTHPLSFRSNYKKLIYFTTAILALVFIGKRMCIVPSGPISKIWPFSSFKHCNWSFMVDAKFLKNGRRSYEHFIYYGTLSIKKGFINYLKFYRKKYSFRAVGYLEEKSLINNCINYFGINNDNYINANAELLVWTSKLEAYGLVFREYVKSGGAVLFLRKYNKTDRIHNGMYLYSDNYDNVHSIVLKLANSFNQSLVPDSSANLVEYIKNE